MKHLAALLIGAVIMALTLGAFVVPMYFLGPIGAMAPVIIVCWWFVGWGLLEALGYDR